METVLLKINDTNIWLVLEKLMFYKNGKLKERNGFICYFNLRLPLTEPYGELILNENNSPKVFTSKKEMETFTLNYLRDRLDL